jgi:hypothetical protein
MFRDVIASVPFLHGCAEQFLSAVLCCMQPVLFAPSDVMLERGQMDLSMYLIIKGRALVTSIDYKVRAVDTRVNSRARVPQKLTTGRFLYVPIRYIDFKCPYSSRPVKTLTPFTGLWRGLFSRI